MPLQSQHGVDWIVDELMAAPDDGLTLCALGPLTNIAMAMIKEPRILPKIREIIMMGGAFFAGGNTTPVAEFNIYVDPHAAQVVFSSGCPLTLVPLDVTHRTLTTPARLDRLRAIGTPVSRAAADMLEFFGRYDMAKYGIEGGPLHDPCVVALLLRPDLFEGRRVHVEVELQSQTTLGMTVMDWWHVNGQQPNCTVISEIDADGFYDLITERLARL